MNLYQFFELTNFATTEEIKESLVKKCKEARSEQQLNYIFDCYNVLINPEKRKKYDRELSKQAIDKLEKLEEQLEKIRQMQIPRYQARLMETDVIRKFL